MGATAHPVWCAIRTPDLHASLADELSPVQRAVVALCRHPDAPQVDWADATDDLPVHEIVATAARWGVIALVHSAARDRGFELLAERLGPRIRRQALRSMGLVHALVQIYERARAAGIEPVVVKGPVLSQQLYGDPSSRRCIDLDLVVDAAELCDLIDVLGELGFAAMDDIGHWVDALRAGHVVPIPSELTLIRDDRTMVDLHSTYRRDGRPGALAPLSTAAVTIAGTSVTTLADGDNLDYLLSHGHKHGWQRLMWLLDVDRLIRATPHGTVEHALAEAERGRRMVAVGTALLVAHELLGLQFEAGADVMQRAEVRAHARRIVRWMGRTESGASEALSMWLMEVRSLDHPSQIGRFVGAMATDVVTGDLGWVKLPPRLMRLYPLMRPARMVARYWPAAREMLRRGDRRAADATHL